MKSCDEYAALLDAFADGECTAAESALFRSHLEECPRCRAALDEVLLLRSAFPNVEDTPVPGGFAGRVMAALPPQSAPRKKRNAVWWTRRLAPLAACLLVAAALWKLPGNMTDRSSMADTQTMESGAAASADTSAAAETEGAAGEKDAETNGDSTQAFTARSAREGETTSDAGTSGAAAAQPASRPAAAAGGGASGDKAESKAAPLLTDGIASPGTDGTAADGSGENGAEDNGTGGNEAGENDAEKNGAAGLIAAAVAAPENSREFTDRALTVFETGGADADAQTRAHRSALYAENGKAFAYYGKWSDDDIREGLYLCFGDGTAASLPLPLTAAGESAAPASLTFDGDLLTYTVTFSDDASAEDGTVLHVRGTYSYTVDVAAETVSLAIC